MTDPLLLGLPDTAEGTAGAAGAKDPLLDGLPDLMPSSRPAVLRAGRMQPDQFVEAERTGAELGLPADLVARNKDEVTRIKQQRSLDELRQRDPDLANWLMDGENLTVSQDDVGALSRLSAGLTAAGGDRVADTGLSGLITGKRDVPWWQRALDVGGQLPSGFNEFFGSGLRGLGNLNDAAARTVDRGIRYIPGGEWVSDNVLRAPIPAWLDPSQLARGAGNLITDNTVVNLPAERQNTATTVSRGIGQILGQVATTYVAPGSTVALNVGSGADQAQQMVDEAGASGTAGGDVAVIASAPVAMVLEKLGLDALLKRAPPGVQNKVVRYVTDKVVAAGIEGSQEAAEQAAYNAIAQAAYNPDQDLGEGITDNFEGGAYVGGVARIIFGGRYARTRAEREGATLDVLGDSAAASALRARDPVRFRQMIEALAKEGTDRVYLNAEQAQTYFQSAGLDPASLGIDPEAMAEAVAIGGDVTIPMSDWLTAIAPDHGKELGKFARLTPAGMDRAELETFDDALDGAAMRFLESVYEAENGQGAVRDVYNDVLGQQLANGVPQAEAETQATLIQRAFDYLGGPGDGAWDLYRKYGLKIVQEQPELVRQLSRRPNIEAAIDSLIDRLRTGDVPADDRISLADFIAGGGGVTDAKLTGELKTLDENDRVARKGKKRLVRADATRDLDRAREAAAEQGYLSEDSDINDLLALLDEEMSGRPVYARGEEATQASETRAAMESLAEELDRLGIDVSNTTNEDIKRALFDGGMLDQPAYHGTPHTVDRFSLQKIGSGEGNQAFGWGLYFASQREVAEQYRRNLSRSAAMHGIDFNRDGTPNRAGQIAKQIDAGAGDETIKRGLRILEPKWTERQISKAMQEGRALFDKYDKRGNVYQVEVPDDGDLLDYDKPLSEQPEKVWAALRDAFIARGMPLDESGEPRFFASNPTGQKLYASLGGINGERAASEALLAVGIPGLRYADGNTRGRDGQTHNYVIWDEAAISEPTRLYQADGTPTTRRGFIQWAADRQFSIGLTPNADRSTFFHEAGHFLLEVMADIAGDASQTSEAPPPAAGMTRLYHGSATPGRYDGKAWFSTSREYAENYRGDTAELQYVDVPTKELNERADPDGYGQTPDKGFVYNVELDSNETGPRQPVVQRTEIAEDFARLQQWWVDEADHVLATLPAADRVAISAAGGADLIKQVAADFRGDHGPATQAARTALHEYTARGFERYLAEGKAPTPETAGMFARLRAWMIEVYKSLAALNVNLSDDVRGVFDRMIAGDRALERAEQAAGLEPLFKEASALGWSDTRFGEYLRLMRAGHEEAEARLAARAIDEVAREHKKWWREESATVQREVEAELYVEPVYQAWSNLQFGTQPDGSPLPDGVKAVKLDKQWLLDRYGQAFLNKHLLRKQVYAVEGGVNPDLFAATYGFRDGNALVDALANALPLQTAVKAETQSRMRERHGDMRMDPQLPEQAARAIHNSKTMKAIAAEVAALEELTGSPKMSPAAVREWASRKIAGTRVRDLTPYQYLRAERKHARQAVIAAGKGDMVGALTASRRRLANATLYAEAAKARDTAEKRTTWLKAQTKSSTQERLGKAGMIYRDSINDVLASLAMRVPTAGEQARKKPLRQSVDTLHEQGNEVAVAESVILRVDAGRVVDPRELTVTELTESYEAVKSLKHVAGQQNKLLATEAKVTRDEAIAEMVARAEEVLPDRLPETLSARDRTLAQQTGERVAKLFGEMDRPENVIEALDGGESGPWHTYYWGALDRAEAAGTAYRRKLATALRDLRKSLPGDFMSNLGADVTLPFGPRVSRNTLIGIVLNTGNATNLQRLKAGGIHYQGKPIALDDGQVQALRDLLTPDEARYVQGLWDTVNSLWPDIVTLQTEMTGIPPEKVEAQAFTAGGTEMRGGYWPLAYDHAKSDAGERQSDDDAMRLMMGQGYSRATTPKGYTKSRVETLNAALQLDFGTVMSRHLDNVMTDLAYRKAVKDITAFMRNPSIKDAIIGRLGQHAYDNLKGALAYSVSPSDITAQAAGMWRAFQGKIISNAAVSALAIRPDIALGNYASALVQASDRAGIRALARGWWEFHTKRTEIAARIKVLSPFMAQRVEDIDYYYRQELGKTQGRSGFGDAYKRVMMTLHRWADHDVTQSAWWGRYKNEFDAGASSAEAARLADAMVRQTQTASGRKDLSTLERDPAFRESRMFMGPMFVIMGRMRAAARGEGATRSVGARAASLMLQVMVAPSIFMLAAGRLPEDEDDDQEIGAGEWAWWIARNTFLFPMQAMPIVREAGAALEAALTDKPISPRAAPTAQAAAGLVKSSKEIAKNIENYQDTGEMDWTEMTRDLAVGAGPLTGLPSSQIRITTRTVDAILDDPDREADEFARMAIYGPPR